MAANSNMNYYYRAIAAPAFNRHAFAFQTEAVSSSMGMIPVTSDSGFGNVAGITAPDGNCGAANSTAGSVVPGSILRGGFLLERGLKHENCVAASNTAGSVVPGGSSSGGFHLESGIKHENCVDASNTTGSIVPGCSSSGGFLLESGLKHENCVATSETAGSIVPGGSSTGGFLLESRLKHDNCVVASNTTGSIVPGCNSSGGFLLEGGLKNDTALALDWSAEEQSILEEGLEKYAEESSIMRYIKVAALLRDKTVRDVALRCRWMTKKDSGKRRKPDEHSMGKKLKDGKEKLMDTSPKMNIPTSIQPNMPYSLMMQRTNYNDHTSYGVGGITRHLLDENAQTFGQIAANLGACKIEDNIDLLCRTKNNLLAVLNDMRETPGIMSQMPPLPVSIDEELASTILPSGTQASSQAFMCWTSSGIRLKPEPQF